MTILCSILLGVLTFAVYKYVCRYFYSQLPLFPHRYEWAFEQDEISLSYRGHIRKGREIFVTFEFAPDKSFHKLKI